MCSKTSSPDTSAQNAEAERQRAQEQQLAAERLAAENLRYEQQRADEERRYQSQLAAQQAEAERQRAQAQAEYERQAQQQAAVEAARQQEAADVRAQAAAKAQAAREFAAGRQTKMDEATGAVNDAYAGFDGGYFNNFAKQFTDYYAPQLEREAKVAKDVTTNAYADAGNLRSSAAAKSFGDLQRGQNEKQGEIASAAIDRANSFENDIIGQKQDALTAINSAAATASPVLADGSFDVASGLGGLQQQLGALTTTAKNRAQKISHPLPSAANLNLSLKNYARRPGVAA